MDRTRGNSSSFAIPNKDPGAMEEDLEGAAAAASYYTGGDTR